MHFAKIALDNGGSIHPLIIPSYLTNGTGLMNPSIYNDNGKLMVNLRHVNYTFYHSEKKTFQHQWGPLTYVHPENDMHLRTTNYYLELDDSLKITRVNKIDTSELDKEPLWDFVGLEDARLFRWGGDLYISGVRRDTTTNGQGRMELSKIIVGEDYVKEVSRVRIEPPKDPNSYCEKNWMPIPDMDWHYVKWSNPTEVVKVNPTAGTSETIALTQMVDIPRDVRGGSHVLPLGDNYYFALTHEVDLFKSEVGRKDGLYRHRFLVWDKNWQIQGFSKDFSFMDAHVEFCTGMCYYKGDLLMTFGFQDNAAYVLRVSPQVVEDFIAGKYDEEN
jgi:hypothetical protein